MILSLISSCAVGQRARLELPGSRKRSLQFPYEEFELNTTEEVEKVVIVGDVDAPLEPRICVICTDTPTGFHYKAMTCEGCKGFFRRTVQRNLASTYKCIMGRNNCMISPKTRVRCQACRWNKCIAEGMIPALVLNSEERLAKQLVISSNRKRIRLERRRRKLVEAMGDLDQPGNEGDGEGESSTQDDSPEMLSRATRKYGQVLSKAYFECFQSDDRENLTSPWPVTNFLMDPTLTATKPFVQLVERHLTHTANFIEMIPNLKDLTLDDKINILTKCGLKILLLRAAQKMGTEPANIGEDVVLVYRHLGCVKSTVARLAFDETVFAFFAALLLCQSDECQYLTDPDLIARTATELRGCIIEYSQFICSVAERNSDLVEANFLMAQHVPLLFGANKPLFDLDVDWDNNDDDSQQAINDLYRYFY